jgi:FtsH-binding integral membrane protein
MTQVQFVADLGNDAVFFACAGSVAFLAVYILLARGYRSEIGRALITLAAGLTLALGPSVLHRLFGLSLANMAYAWYFVASITLVGIAAWWQTWLVIKVQWRGRHDPPGLARPPFKET